MKLEDIDALFVRIKRLSESLSVKSGTGTNWAYTFPGGETHTYRLENMRPPEQIEDDVANMCIWVWSLKDHLKELAAARGFNNRFIEDNINKDEALAVCGDLANLFKHGRLNKSRSGKFPKVLRPQYEIPQEAVENLEVKAFEVITRVSKPELVDIFVPIQDKDGNTFGDALVYLRLAILKWEAVRDEIVR